MSGKRVTYASIASKPPSSTYSNNKLMARIDVLEPAAKYYTKNDTFSFEKQRINRIISDQYSDLLNREAKLEPISYLSPWDYRYRPPPSPFIIGPLKNWPSLREAEKMKVKMPNIDENELKLQLFYDSLRPLAPLPSNTIILNRGNAPIPAGMELESNQIDWRRRKIPMRWPLNKNSKTVIIHLFE